MKNWKTGALTATLLLETCTLALAGDDKPNIWTGAYIGAHVGYGQTKWSFEDASSHLKASGAIGGIHGGYNHQLGHVIIGAELDHSFGGLEKKLTVDDVTATFSTSGLTSLRARLGFTVAPSLLLYGTVGYGWADLDIKITDGVDTVKAGETAQGIVYGAGAEYRIMPSISLRGEVLQYELRYSEDGGTLKVPVTTGRAGLSFHF